MARRPHRPRVVSLSGQDPVPVQAPPRRVEGNHVSQAGQAFADLLLVGATAARCPLAMLTVVSGDGWSTLSFGAEREALEDPELFDIIAGRREPVEVTDPGSNPALANSRLARSTLGIRWLLGVYHCSARPARSTPSSPYSDTEPRELAPRQRASMVATGRLISGALSAHRAADTYRRPACPPRTRQRGQAGSGWAFAACAATKWPLCST